jgi:hypothetical protein
VIWLTNHLILGRITEQIIKKGKYYLIIGFETIYLFKALPP